MHTWNFLSLKSSHHKKEKKETIWGDGCVNFRGNHHTIYNILIYYFYCWYSTLRKTIGFPLREREARPVGKIIGKSKIADCIVIIRDKYEVIIIIIKKECFIRFHAYFLFYIAKLVWFSWFGDLIKIFKSAHMNTQNPHMSSYYAKYLKLLNWPEFIQI